MTGRTGVDEDRAIADLRELAKFGKLGTGVSRAAMTDIDMEARQWLRRRMMESGLDAVIDGVGNVYGRAPGAKTSVIVGSHSDTVPRGGWLDGAMGVIFGLEIARARRETHPGAAVGVDAISFADEEGTFLACLGSRSFCQALSDKELEEARNGAGETLPQRLAQLQLAGTGLARVDPSRHRAYFEAHIEQGPRLIDSRIDVGVVSGIVGLRRHRVRFEGQADHAGTTPMATRRDAAFALFGFATAAAERFRAVGSAESVWNFGVVNVRPGAANVVPSEAELVVEFRDLETRVMERMEQALLELARASDGAGGVAISSTLIASIAPTAMDERLIAKITAAARAEGASSLRMQSGAGHDAMILARRVPAAMLFVPSIGGRSHDISEDTDEADIRRGLRVFAAAVESTIEALGPEGEGAL
jgi:beta-ureidopropionase / N-carbamoyl-L-amino-acid hydrolase